jgi:hypothetical protein
MWKLRRGKAIDAAQFDLMVRNKLQAIQFARTGVGPKVSHPKPLSEARCKLCGNYDCNPGRHKITWMNKDCCPWCWAMQCTPDVHVEGLARIAR